MNVIYQLFGRVVGVADVNYHFIAKGEDRSDSLFNRIIILYGVADECKAYNFQCDWFKICTLNFSPASKFAVFLLLWKIPNMLLPVPVIEAYLAPDPYSFSLISFNSGCVANTGASNSFTSECFHES